MTEDSGTSGDGPRVVVSIAVVDDGTRLRDFGGSRLHALPPGYKFSVPKLLGDVRNDT